MSEKLFAAISKLEKPIEQLLRERRPDCLVSDMFYPWTADVCAQLGIPRILFHVTGLFPLCCEESVRRYAPHEKRPSFYDLEPTYAEHYQNEMGRKLWLVGPVYLFNKAAEEKAERGEKNSIDGGTVLSWLDSKKPNSVIYVSFGSQVRMAPKQFLEIAHGLEASGCPFIWVARDLSKNNEEDKEKREGGEGENGDKMLPDGFEERMTKSGQGLIVRSWAPQLLILEHVAAGGFMTHCGWNSTIEGIGAGIPMITWPLAAEQFFIESLVTDVLKTGIRVENEEWVSLHWEPKVTVTREKVEKAVKWLIGGDGGDQVVEMRRRAREMAEKAKKAMDYGGSSDAAVIVLINELKSRRSVCE
ncbi:Abscisate beta-glucosyltransferase [Camellia lanceoleosa]|uniref:Abscisate beta-glucosyltransferase n=1 Tax=Camellia lanceoleosa TaxID=1840588 RepID=A0ACC0IZ76_9ERIC|nr:Abscisate beta-glucosyltransferase [Camellia lanceoleosa]